MEYIFFGIIVVIVIFGILIVNKISRKVQEIRNDIQIECEHNSITFSDGQLENMINYWLDHYTVNGESHYNDTPDWKIREIYWDKIVSRVIEDVNIEMTDDEIERFCDRLADL